MDGSMRILVVDDCELARTMVSRVLQGVGHDCDCAENGEEALARTRSKQYDLVITDLGMPFLDGYELIRRFRESATNTEIPILVMSATAQDPEILKTHRLHGFLEKPFGAQDLRQLVQQIASGSSPASADLPVGPPCPDGAPCRP